MNEHDRRRKAVIVGAGPVGCLAALALAQLGWVVDIYERRSDLRLPSSKASLAQRSVNLAISSRGLAALEDVNHELALRFLEKAIPMKGRMIHHLDGGAESQIYDREGQCINSIDRGILNEGLLDEVSAVPSIRVFFEYKFVRANFDQRILTFEATPSAHPDGVTDNTRKAENGAFPTRIEVGFDFCVGADGSFSGVRQQMMRVVRMNYEQEYIPHEYVELRMPAGPPHTPGGPPTFLIDPGHLHIWPRHSFMLIALPNQDCTFTCTVFAPTTELDKLRTRKDASEWFNRHFPDAVHLIGEDNLLDDFERNPRSPLIHLKARPYHYKDRVILLGDAGHSMVPFFGQGLNCGLEDVRVLITLFRKHGAYGVVGEFGHNKLIEGDINESVLKALEEYTETRYEDLVAICDLAMANYTEMRHSVTTPLYRIKKSINTLLSCFSATSIIPPGSSPLQPTTFSNRTQNQSPNNTPVDLSNSASVHTPIPSLSITPRPPSPTSSSSSRTFVDSPPSSNLNPNITTAPPTTAFTGTNPRGWLPLYTMVTFRADIPYSIAKRRAEKQGNVLELVGWSIVVVGLGTLGLGMRALVRNRWHLGFDKH
jgi:kynurenine 3-monooxygenase